MRILRLADPDSQARSRTSLGESLIQLKSGQPPAKETAVTQADQTELQSWHDRFSSNHEQITRRLSLIEAELDRLVGPGPEPPQLTVFEERAEVAAQGSR
mgnify:CR=1 FL=1